MFDIEKRKAHIISELTRENSGVSVFLKKVKGKPVLTAEEIEAETNYLILRGLVNEQKRMMFLVAKNGSEEDNRVFNETPWIP